MIGIQIFLHSLRQVTGNISMAVRVSWWFVLVLLVGLYTVISMVFSNPSQPEFSGMAAILTLALMVFGIWGASLIAVVWHRYILLEETPKPGIPYRPGLNVWTYFWYGVGIGIILLVVALVLTTFLSMFIVPNTIIKSAVFSLIVGSAMMVLFYRLALILPAVAISTTLTLGDAMQATRSAMGPILVLAVAGVIFSTVLSTLVGLVLGGDAGSAMMSIENNQMVFTELTGMGIISGLANAAVQWFSFMLGISILSTLYGHFIEKRSLN